MKKFISVLVASCMLISSASTANAATGKIVDNRTLVPVRGVFEELGFVVIWNEKKSMATIKDKNYTIEIPKGKDYFMINGESVKPEVPQQIIDGNFYFPLRAVGDYIGADTWWDNSTKTAHIIYNEKHSYVICKAEEAVSEQILNVDLYEEAYKSDMNMLTELINENFNALKWNDYDKSYVVAASLVRYCELDIYGTLEDAQAIGIFKDILSLNPDSIYVYRVDEENFDNAAKTVFNISKGELRTSIGKGGLVYKDGYYYIVSGWFEVHDSPDFYIESYDKLSDGTYLIIFAPNTKENKNFNMDKLDCIAGLRTINGKKVWRIYSFGNFYFS